MLIKIILFNLVTVITCVVTAATVFEEFVDKRDALKTAIAVWIVVTFYSIPVLLIILITMI